MDIWVAVCGVGKGVYNFFSGEDLSFVAEAEVADLVVLLCLEDPDV